MSKTKLGQPYNDYKPVARGDYGIRVARNGFDAVTSGDSNLLFNSGWRIIQIVKVISEANKIIHIDETQNIPSGQVPTGRTTVWGVWNWNCGVDEQWLYLPKIAYEYRDSNYRLYFYHKQYKIYHGLGYIPLFFKSEFCADQPGYYLMTNLDIRQDADYPYTAKPSYYDGNTKDYGIKSKSRTRAYMPQSGETRGCGINTSIQSKLVMAVKTEKSRTSDKFANNDPAPCPSWAVPQDSNAQTTKLYDYESFGFYSEDGKIFIEYPTGPYEMVKPGGGDVYTLVGQAGVALQNVKSALAILRSPMVAPGIEEFTIL